ncbi:MAG: hypothetical protein Q9180_008218, partial [Flavoplaca navasiana]
MPYVSVPRVSSPPFSYDRHSGFHIYDKDRHQVYKRHDPKELYALLTYDAAAAKYTKAGKLRKNPPKHTDETQHFYNAQLTHYGLSPTKSKQAAKVALLQVYESENNLTVPPHILKLEENLRSQFRAKEAKLLEEAISKRNEEYELEEKQRAKRKREEDAVVAEIEEAIITSNKKQKKTHLKPLDIHNLAGTYLIVAPQVSEGWDCQGPLQLQLAPSSTAKHLWGTFDFGVFEGKMRSQPLITSTKPSRSIKFFWRGRETGE